MNYLWIVVLWQYVRLLFSTASSTSANQQEASGQIQGPGKLFVKNFKVCLWIFLFHWRSYGLLFVFSVTDDFFTFCFSDTDAIVRTTKHADGTEEHQYSDGTVQFLYPDGTTECHLTSGNIQKTAPDGTMYYNGVIVDQQVADSIMKKVKAKPLAPAPPPPPPPLPPASDESTCTLFNETISVVFYQKVKVYYLRVVW